MPSHRYEVLGPMRKGSGNRDHVFSKIDRGDGAGASVDFVSEIAAELEPIAYEVICTVYTILVPNQSR